MRRISLAPLAAVLVVGLGVGCSVFTPSTTERSVTAPVDLDVLYIGAHPDDEASVLSTFGQWHSSHQVRTGVVTVTRGEGGGNAVGDEEGPALGQLREAEERRAVGKAGITEIFNLDKADFYYTVSSALTEQGWGHDDTLARMVSVIRQTRPEIVITMDPSPQPGNHGNHQLAARLAIEAYRAAADPAAFPEQLTRERLSPWSVSRLFFNGMRLPLGEAQGQIKLGRDCESAANPADSPGRVYAVWAGRPAPDGRGLWAKVEREAQREYATQGWAGFPDRPTDPQQVGCDYFTEIAGRVPHAADDGGPDAMLHGALLEPPGGLPLRTGLTVTAPNYRMVGGERTTIRVEVTAPEEVALPDVMVTPRGPPGWAISGNGALGTVAPGQSRAMEFTVAAPANATQGRAWLSTELTSAGRKGYAETALEVTTAVRAEQRPLPQVAEFQLWAQRVGVPAIADSVPPVLTVPSGGSREIGVLVHNDSGTAQSGSVELVPPAGFRVDPPEQPFNSLPSGQSTTAMFMVRNTDAGLRTGMQGGDYRYRIITRTTDEMSATTHPAWELIPSTTVMQTTAAPTVDGVANPGEYPGRPLSLSSQWEGDACSSAADCSATAQLSWHGDTLYALIAVADDVAGSKLAPADCKRHWRTDSVELAIDPRGSSENTSTTFKLATLPITDDPAAGNPPCYLRDADNHQGFGRQTAPGVEVVSRVDERYAGYTVEFAIPLAVLPMALDPQRVGLNLLVYDSDTQDKTGQTRLGWSTWGGVQGDPYRWGLARFDGYTPPASRPTTAAAPVLPG